MESFSTSFGMARPLTAMWSLSGSTLAPVSVTTLPLTSTLPAAISATASRRDATPAAASTFCNRSDITRSEQEEAQEEGSSADWGHACHRPCLPDGARGHQIDPRHLVPVDDPDELAGDLILGDGSGDALERADLSLGIIT